MKRTWLSVLGGILLLLLSLGTGLGGLFYVALSQPETMAEALKQYRQALDQAEKSGKADADQQKAFQEMRKRVAEFEQRISEPDGKDWLAKWRPFGYFEVFTAALGLVGAVSLMIGGAFGRVSGTLAGTAGAATCIWGSMIGVPPEVSTGMQIVCLLGYVVVILGASTIRGAQPKAA